MSIVKSLSVGEGDMFYIRHNTDNFSIVDCCLERWNQERIIDELKQQSSNKTITRFISTHPDDDHIRGIKTLFDKMDIPNFYCVSNSADNPNGECDFEKYCSLRDSKGCFNLYKDCRRKWMNVDSDSNDEEKRYNSGINILWPVLENEHHKETLDKVKEWKDPNNLSPIIKYSIQDGGTFLWFGDMESTYQEKIHDKVSLPKADVVFAPHHGRDSGKLILEWLQKMEPQLIIVGEAPSDYLCYYPGYDTITQNSAGDITFVCEKEKIDIYVENENYDQGCTRLKNAWKDSTKTGANRKSKYGYYVGTLLCNRG